MDLKIPITIVDELSDAEVHATGMLDLASGDIGDVKFIDYDVAVRGVPAEALDYEFTCGMLSNLGRDVEFRIDVDVVSGRYSVTPTELLELKGRAARLFAKAPTR